MLDLSPFSTDYALRSSEVDLYCRRSAITGRAALSDAVTDFDLVPPASRAADWLEAVGLRRDQAAFVALFRYYAPRIKTYLRRLGAEDPIAEELAQEAMLLVWRKSALFDRRRASASTWIFAIARNVRVDRLRREHRPELDPVEPDGMIDPTPAADDKVAAGRRDRQLRAVLSQLSVEQASVITLSFFEDLPHGEISRQLGLPLGTVKSRLRLALRRLRSLIGETL
jgi:RNA polymerase sigma-70 factor (ECF subfamily)